MFQQFKNSSLAKQLVTVYLIISTISAFLFFSSICARFLSFGAGLCLVPVFPWSLFFLPNFILGSIIGFTINLILVYLIGLIADKLFKVNYDAKVIFIIAILILIIIASYFGVMKIFEYGLDCRNNYDPDACYFSAATQNSHLEICNKIKNQGSRDRCQGSVMGDQKNPEGCFLLPTQNSKDYCYAEIARLTKDYLSCNSILDNNIRDNCLFFSIPIDANKSDAEICEMSDNQSYKNRCYERFGIMLNDEFFCSKIEDVTAPHSDNSLCYQSVARKKLDSSLCEKIDRESDKNECRENVSYSKSLRSDIDKNNQNNNILWNE